MQKGKLGEGENGGRCEVGKKIEGTKCFKMETTAAAAVHFG